MYPFRELIVDEDPTTDGLHYRGITPSAIVGAPFCATPYLYPDVAGSFLSRLRHTVATPFNAAARVATAAIETPFNVAAKIATTPFALAARAANALPSMPSDSPGAPGPASPSAPPSDPTSPEGDPMSADASGFSPFRGFRGVPHALHHMHRPHMPRLPFGLAPSPAVLGFHLTDYLPPFMRSKPAGELLVSSVPGGATALQARNIANTALKNGTLKPAHVKKASNLLRAARGGHKGSIKKIAAIKASAGRGDPHAEVALDRLKLVDSICRGTKCAPGSSGVRHLHNLGLATLRRA